MNIRIRGWQDVWMNATIELAVGCVLLVWSGEWWFVRGPGPIWHGWHEILLTCAVLLGPHFVVRAWKRRTADGFQLLFDAVEESGDAFLREAAETVEKALDGRTVTAAGAATILRMAAEMKASALALDAVTEEDMSAWIDKRLQASRLR